MGGDPAAGVRGFDAGRPKKAVAHVNAGAKKVNLHNVLGKRRFPKKARIEVSVTRDQRIGRVLQYNIGTPGLPKVAFLCKPPDAEAGPC